MGSAGAVPQAGPGACRCRDLVGEARLFCTSAGDKGKGERRGATAPMPTPLPPTFPGKILIVIKCFLIMLRCELLNAILARKHICEYFAFSNIKNQANVCLPLHVQKLKVF